MTIEQAIAAYSRLSSEQQVQLLAEYAHWLTIVARETYEVGAEQVLDPCRLRELNEIQHRATGYLRSLLNRNEPRYPDDVIVRVITGEADQRLLRHFEKVLKGV